LISQFVSEMHKKKNITESILESMSPEEIRNRLLNLLAISDPTHSPIPPDHKILADNLIALEKMFVKITQNDIKESAPPGQKYKKKHLQAIGHACKQMELSQSTELVENVNELVANTEVAASDNVNSDDIENEEDKYMMNEQQRVDEQQYEDEMEDENDSSLYNGVDFSVLICIELDTYESMYT
jgi:hypothetical protein